MDSHESELARMRAEIDQAIAGMGELARASWTFFDEMQKQGFNESQAMELVATWLTSIAIPPMSQE